MNKLMALIFPFVLLGFTLVFFEYWIPHHGDGLQRALQILVPDLEMGWRQKANLKTKFQGQKLITDQFGLRNLSWPQEESKILALGPSSSFGWGVSQKETYSVYLEKQLNEAGHKYRVINAGEIGYSSRQGYVLYQRLKSLNVLKNLKYVILAYGINDLDRFRFIGRGGPSDVEYFNKENLNFINYWRPLFHFAFGKVLYRAWQESIIYRQCGNEKTPGLRMPIDEFGKQMEEFIDQIRRDGAEPIILGTVLQSKAIPFKERENESEELYQKSEKASASGKCGLSRQYFRQARSLEGARLLRDVSRLNEVTRELAIRKKTPFVDLVDLLDGEKSEINFYDPVHFSARGHQKIARKLGETLIEWNR